MGSHFYRSGIRAIAGVSVLNLVVSFAACAPETTAYEDVSQGAEANPCAAAKSGGGFYCGTKPQLGGESYGVKDVLYECRGRQLVSKPIDCQAEYHVPCTPEVTGKNDHCEGQPAPAPAASTASAGAHKGSFPAGPSGEFQVLMYHTVTAEQIYGDLNQAKSLGYAPISIEEFAKSYPNLEALHHRFLITFDDGYKDQVAGARGAERFARENGGTAVPITLFTLTQFEGRPFPPPGDTPVYSGSGHSYMTFDDLTTLMWSDALQVSVFNHTLNHFDLRQTPFDAAKSDIDLAESNIDQLYAFVRPGAPRAVRAYAYPLGVFDPDMVDFVGKPAPRIEYKNGAIDVGRAAAFDFAFSTDSGLTGPNAHLAIPRKRMLWAE